MFIECVDQNELTAYGIPPFLLNSFKEQILKK